MLICCHYASVHPKRIHHSAIALRCRGCYVQPFFRKYWILHFSAPDLSQIKLVRCNFARFSRKRSRTCHIIYVRALIGIPCASVLSSRVLCFGCRANIARDMRAVYPEDPEIIQYPTESSFQKRLLVVRNA